MDIAAMSIDMSLYNVQSKVNVSLLKGAMESQESQAASLISQMMPAVTPNFSQDLGSLLDVRA